VAAIDGPAALSRFARALEQDEVPKGIVVVGVRDWKTGPSFEPWVLEDLLEHLRPRFAQSTFEHDAEADGFDAAALFHDLRASGLFSATRLVVARRAGPLCSFGRRPRKPGERTSFEKEIALFAREAPEGCCVLVALPGAGADAPLAKDVAEAGGAVVVARPLRDPAEIAAWLREELRRRRAALPDAALRTLAESGTGGSLFVLERALEERLAGGEPCFAPGPSSEAGLFAFAQAFLEGKTGEALSLLAEMREWGSRDLPVRDLGRAVPLLVAVLANGARRGALAREALDRGERIEEAARALGVKGWRKPDGTLSDLWAGLERSARARPARSFHRILRELRVLDGRVKSGLEPDVGFALERLLVRTAE